MNKRLFVGAVLLTLVLGLWGGGEKVEAVAGCSVNFNAGYKTISTTVDGRTLELAVWYPTRTAEVATNYGLERKLGVGKAATDAVGASDCKPYPVIIFSHGFHGCAWQSLFLTEQLAKNGYIVAAPNHQDAVCGGEGGLLDFLEPGSFRQFREPEKWSDQTYIDRRDDVRATLDEILKLSSTPSSFLYNKASKTELGLMGHSLGGYTTLGLSGAWSTWTDSRFKALVALSPVIKPYLVKPGSISSIKIPVMIQGGTLDSTITPDFVTLYPQIKSPKVEVILADAGHLAWSNTFCRDFVDSRTCLTGDTRINAITVYATAFFDQFLQNDASAQAKLTTKMAGVYSLRSDLSKATPVTPTTPSAGTSTTSSSTTPTSTTTLPLPTSDSNSSFPRPAIVIIIAAIIFLIYRLIHTYHTPKS